MSARGEGSARRGAGRTGSGRPKYGAAYGAKRPIKGPGLFATCVRGREKRAVAEMIDLLEQFAEQLYPPERVALIAATNAAKWAAGAAGRSASSLAAVQAVVEPESESDEERDESIEASIARELAELKTAREGGTRGYKIPRAAPADGNTDSTMREQRVRPIRPRFESLETGTECLLFIAFKRPYDAVEIVKAIVEDLRATGVSRTTLIQRLLPVTFACHSLSFELIAAHSMDLIATTFHAWAEANGRTTITYQIDPAVRSHDKPLSRQVLVDLLGPLVQSLGGPTPPSADSSVLAAPPRPLLVLSANLKSPDLVLLPQVLKNIYGMSIVEGALWSGADGGGKKFNLDTVGSEARKRRFELEGPTAVRGMEVDRAPPAQDVPMEM